MNVAFIPFEPDNPAHLEAAARIWNAACGPDLSISPRFVAYNTQPSIGVVQQGRIALQNGQFVGFVLASGQPSQNFGNLDAIAVLPAAQRQGIGIALLNWAHHWLKAKGCITIRLGGSPRPFVPGLPAELGNQAFFINRRYEWPEDYPYEWDVANTLRDYQSRYLPPDPTAVLLPTQPGQEGELLGFWERNFPGMWLFECQEHLRAGGRPEDYLMLWSQGKVIGACQVTLEDSLRPMDRYYPQRLPRPWGQLGTIGIASEARGKGYGGFMIDQALLYLRAKGVNGCVIDWTTLLKLYARFGFQPYRQYLNLYMYY